MNRRLLATAIIILLIALAGVWWYFFVHTRVVIVDLNNVESVTVLDSNREEVTQIQAADKSVRLVGGQDYILNYQAADNYANGSTKLTKNQPSISISPDYSSEYYQSLISEALPEVMRLLKDKYPNIDRYSVAEQKMYDRGNWLSLVLKYSGSYGTYTDDLRVIFKKIDDGWSQAAKPDILLDKYDNPDIPYDILLGTNRL